LDSDIVKPHHAAFDSFIIGITPDYLVGARKDIFEEANEPMLKYGLQGMEGREGTRRGGEWGTLRKVGKRSMENGKSRMENRERERPIDDGRQTIDNVQQGCQDLKSSISKIDFGGSYRTGEQFR